MSELIYAILAIPLAFILSFPIIGSIGFAKSFYDDFLKSQNFIERLLNGWYCLGSIGCTSAFIFGPIIHNWEKRPICSIVYGITLIFIHFKFSDQNRPSNYVNQIDQRIEAGNEANIQKQHLNLIESDWRFVQRNRHFRWGQVILPIMGGVIGGTVGDRLVSGDPVIPTLFGAGVGLVLGMFAFRYLPSQKRLRDIERLRRRHL